jgi:hypothetical protein
MDKTEGKDPVLSVNHAEQQAIHDKLNDKSFGRELGVEQKDIIFATNLATTAGAFYAGNKLIPKEFFDTIGKKFTNSLLSSSGEEKLFIFDAETLQKANINKNTGVIAGLTAGVLAIGLAASKGLEAYNRKKTTKTLNERLDHLQSIGGEFTPVAPEKPSLWQRVKNAFTVEPEMQTLADYKTQDAVKLANKRLELEYDASKPRRSNLQRSGAEISAITKTITTTGALIIPAALVAFAALGGNFRDGYLRFQAAMKSSFAEDKRETTSHLMQLIGLGLKRAVQGAASLGTIAGVVHWVGLREKQIQNNQQNTDIEINKVEAALAEKRMDELESRITKDDVALLRNAQATRQVVGAQSAKAASAEPTAQQLGV